MILRTRHVVRSKMIKIYIYAVKTVDAFHDQYICLVFLKKMGEIMGRSWEDHGKIMGIIVNVDEKYLCLGVDQIQQLRSRSEVQGLPSGPGASCCTKEMVPQQLCGHSILRYSTIF